MNLYTKKNNTRRVLILKQPIIILLYKEACLNTNEVIARLGQLCGLSLLSVIVPLLQEFEDIFLKEISNGLPPIRGIKNQIDFITGASIPNRQTYRSNPE